MNTYFSTFIAGFGEVVSKEIVKVLPDVEIELLLDGVIVYKTSAPIEKVATLPFFNNSFYILHYFKKIEPDSLPSMIKFIYQSDFLKRVAVPKVEGRNRTFRVTVSKENELGVINPNLLKNVEEKIAKTTGLSLDRGRADLEFWFVERSEGVGFFALRLTYKRAENLHPGQLRPELAYLLSLLSDPQEEDIFLDPFCGWGAIPKAREQMPYSKILCSDVDEIKVKSDISRGIKAQVADATHLDHIEDSSIDKVVTDPPWGLAEKVDVESLYPQMMKEFSRIIKKEGLLVILTSKKLVFEKLLPQFSEFRLLSNYDVLVNGKKAGVYKLAKIGTS